MITFRSEVGPDVMMFDEIAHRMMDLLGKERSAQGVVTVEQLPAAIAALKDAIAKDRATHQPQAEENEDEAPASRPVSLAQRALPLVELFEISLARGKPVTWGV